MMQLIHDVAPGAGQTFHTAFGGQADFALGIEELAGCPPGSEPTRAPALNAADVIVDDVIYFAEPMFQDGIVAQAVDVVTNAGVSCFSSAGNNARASYEAPFDLAGGLHDFEPGPGVDTCQTITIPTGTTICPSSGRSRSSRSAVRPVRPAISISGSTSMAPVVRPVPSRDWVAFLAMWGATPWRSSGSPTADHRSPSDSRFLSTRVRLRLE